MILVTLGTQDKKFYRLLEAISEEIKKGNIKDKVVVQAGCCSDYKDDNMKILDYLSKDDFNDLVKKSDLVITHGGVGSIIDALKNNKKIIAVPRLRKYGEAANDHQIQIIESFAKKRYLLPLYNFKDFNKVLLELKDFKPQKYKSNKNNFSKLIEGIIDQFLE